MVWGSAEVRFHRVPQVSGVEASCTGLWVPHGCCFAVRAAQAKPAAIVCSWTAAFKPGKTLDLGWLQAKDSGSDGSTSQVLADILHAYDDARSRISSLVFLWHCCRRMAAGHRY